MAALIPPLSATCVCPLRRTLSLRDRMFAHGAVISLQAAWRGHKTRKTLQLQKDEEFLEVLSSWKKLDEAYRLCVLCQNVLVEFHQYDPTWDAEATPYYQAMLTEGRALEQLEIYLLKRGWKRPPPQTLPKATVRLWLKEAMSQPC